PFEAQQRARDPPPVRTRLILWERRGIEGTGSPQRDRRVLTANRRKRFGIHIKLTKQDLYRACVHRESVESVARTPHARCTLHLAPSPHFCTRHTPCQSSGHGASSSPSAHLDCSLRSADASRHSAAWAQ